MPHRKVTRLLTSDMRCRVGGHASVSTRRAVSVSACDFLTWIEPLISKRRRLMSDMWRVIVPDASADRYAGIIRPYAFEEVQKLRGSIEISHTLAHRGANRLWRLLKRRDYVPALGAVTGNQAVQMARAGLKAIYLSGWQVAADANTAGATYPDQSSLSVQFGTGSLSPYQPGAAARRPDRMRRGRRATGLVLANRC